MIMQVKFLILIPKKKILGVGVATRKQEVKPYANAITYLHLRD